MADVGSEQFQRPRITAAMSPGQQADLLRDYLAFYEAAATQNPGLLNQKMDRETAASFLNRVGVLICEEAHRLANAAGPMKAFLNANPLPATMADHLPPEFRAYCLLLNALKQWVAAEQAATDKALLGARARDKIRAGSERCVISGVSLGEACELHHPVRDGRPPIPISPLAHAALEGQTKKAASEDDSALSPIFGSVRRERNQSWRNLRRGCLELLGRPVAHSTPAVKAGSLSFARKCIQAGGVGAEDILRWLDQSGLG